MKVLWKTVSKINQTEFRIEKVIKKRWKSEMPNGKVIITHLTAGLIKMSYVSEPYRCSKNKIKAELCLSNYATNSDLKKCNSC